MTEPYLRLNGYQCGARTMEYDLHLIEWHDGGREIVQVAKGEGGERTSGKAARRRGAEQEGRDK